MKIKTLYILLMTFLICSCGKLTPGKDAVKVGKKVESLGRQTGETIGNFGEDVGDVFQDFFSWTGRLFVGKEDKNTNAPVIYYINNTNNFYSEKEVLIPTEVSAEDEPDSGTENSLVDGPLGVNDELEVEYTFETEGNDYKCTYSYKKMENPNGHYEKMKIKSCTDGSKTELGDDLLKSPIKKRMKKDGKVKFQVKKLKREDEVLINDGKILKTISNRKDLKFECEIKSEK